MPSNTKSRGAPTLKTVRICVIGPSFCGKTQIVNRIVNNSFFPQYNPTDELETYKIYYNKANNVASAPDFVQIEILDCFPQDHPLLFTDANSDLEARTMQDNLKRIIENFEGADGDKGKKQQWINAFIFVYDAHDVTSFRKLLKIIRSVHEFETSNNLGVKADENGDDNKVWKYVLGSKKDLKK